MVITLILLSVTLFMAIAFLAVSRRERGSVLTETDTVTARLAADSALASAQAQILATVLQTTNPFNFGLLVSTNYINANGFNNSYNNGLPNPTNVSYVYGNGNPLNTIDDFNQNVANLFFLPRAPVFAYDRTTGSNEFRFYLDLNRNRTFDANGRVANLEVQGLNVFTNGFIQEVGDPEWIGVLERPDAPHGPNNKFLSRYAFIALPAGNTLDLNAIHNEVLNQSLGTADGFFRNQGVGTWEINLAAFLADLNTNEWNAISSSYNYSRGFNINNQNTGAAFDDARALLAYRYNFNYNSLSPFSALLPYYPAGGGAVDMFPIGPVMATTGVPFYNYGLNVMWPGADNTNHYFALASDLFDPAKTQNGIGAFINRLQFASTNVSTYDRYTFYRMLAQLGTDSAQESGKLNVNYQNMDNNGNIIPGMETNSYAWNPQTFFVNAADRLLLDYTAKWFQAGPSNYLATYYGIHYTNRITVDAFGVVDGLTNAPFFGITNTIPTFGVTAIPVLVNSNYVYAPAVQRVLQLAANILDATTNRTAALGKDFPSVFRPLFSKNAAGNVFATSYTNVSSVAGANLFPLLTPIDARTFASLPGVLVDVPDNIYGVPWIIGAKKGFPNFNEISMQDVVTVTRKLQVTRASTTPGAALTATNAQYNFSINSAIGVEFWNSYTNAYTNALEVVVWDYVTLNLTNDLGYDHGPTTYTLSQNGTYNYWPGSVWRGGDFNYRVVNSSFPTNAFYIPIYANIGFLTNQTYLWGGGFSTVSNAGWQTGRTDLLLPHFGLTTTNRLQAYILATDSTGQKRVIDYVHFNGPNSQRDLNNEIQPVASVANTISYENMWDTNIASGIPLGIANQLSVSQGSPAVNMTYWNSTDANFVKAEIYGFTVFMGGTPTFALPTGYAAVYQGYVSNLTVQVPFTPTVTAYGYTSWQANDPLVHSLPGDLVFSGYDPDTGSVVQTGVHKVPNRVIVPLLPDLGMVNARYKPWGKAQQALTGLDQNPYNPAYKDPLVRQSDNWDFPANKLPSVGWLGRIHRGTPWQTVFLKATNILNLVTATTSGLNTWSNWTGNSSAYDAINTAPVQDRGLFDVFTTALNGNATRGQLPINVGAGDPGNPAAGLAAWSAVFSGMAVPTNMLGAYTIINPVGVDAANSTLYAIVTNINFTRALMTNTTSQGGAFKRLGDILAVPALTQNSPFLTGLNLTNNLPDALYEWLPQQTMSLLRLSDQPRFVIYSLGQTLTPAPNGVVNNGPYAGMITNYQVTAETATRSVLRIEGAPTNTRAVIESYNLLPPD
ncbi:MAG: hypothetical protein WCS42_07650 [Verrucomicrobiota bacterium]